MRVRVVGALPSQTLAHPTRSKIFATVTLSALILFGAGCGDNAHFSSKMPVKSADLKSANLHRVEQTVKAAAILDGALELSPENKTGSAEVTLKNDQRDEAKRMLQITRPTVTKTFKQGNPGTNRSESFNQSELGIVDIQIVVDNSGSMAEEQANLATKLTPLLRYLSGRDWRININSTDPAWGCSNTLIKKGDANIDSTFQAGVTTLGTKGSGIERGILQAVNGLSCSSNNWTRSNSTVAVLILSDEENCSASAPLDSCVGQAYRSENYLLNHLTNVMGRKLGETARVYGIFHVPGTVCTSAMSEGGVYQAAVTATNGKSGSICDADYTSTLNSISEDIATVLNQDFNLADIPDAGSLVIRVDGVPINTGFKLTGKSVKLNVAPPLGSVIQADYTTGKTTPIVTTFALGETPVEGSVKVWINSTLAAASSYGINTMTNELVFATAPAISADIKVEFKKNLTMLTKFSVNSSIIPGTLAVKVNGAATTDFKMNSPSEFEFNAAPAEGATIDASYRIIIAPIYAYPVAIDSKLLKSVEFTDPETDQEVKAKHSGTVLVVDKSEFKDGRKVRMDFHYLGSGELAATLPSEPLPDTLTISATEAECARKIKLPDIFLDCKMPADSKVKINWKYRDQVKSEFALDTVKFPEFGSWQVKINGVETTAYTRTGNKISLNQKPAPTDEITIIYVPKET